MDSNHTTPRARRLLPFATSTSRPYTASPLGFGNSRMATTTPGSSRKLDISRGLETGRKTDSDSTAAARSDNVFTAAMLSSGSKSRSSGPKSHARFPDIFAPAASPAPAKLPPAAARPSGAAAAAATAATPSRNKLLSSDLFVQRIPDPPHDLTGEMLAQTVPKDLELRGTVYADQYLSHLVPRDFNDEQRRQFFCILDLRRLKFSANDIFARKDWRINIMNFAKEFEKSRSMIMLRYGLYEFKNVKPSADILRKWRARHGLPDPDEDMSDPTTGRNGFPQGAKRKAEDELASQESTLGRATRQAPNSAKRRALDTEYSAEPPDTADTTSSNKRKAFCVDDIEDDQPPKIHKSSVKPSATRLMFEEIARTPRSSSGAISATPSGPKSSQTSAPISSAAKPGVFAAQSRPTNGAARSVFENLKAGSLQPNPTGNIFAHLSNEASPAKNSQAADDHDMSAGEDEDEGEGEDEDQDEGVEEVEAQAQTETQTQAQAQTPAGKGLFGATKPAVSFGSADPVSRESSPAGGGLFGRVGKIQRDHADKNKDTAPASPAPASTSTPAAAPAKNQTWTTDTPIKFGASAAPHATDAEPPASAKFGGRTSTPAAGSLFAGSKPAEPAKPVGPSPAPFAFGSSQPGQPTESIFAGSKPPLPSELFGAKPADDNSNHKESSKSSHIPPIFGQSAKASGPGPAFGFGAAKPATDKPTEERAEAKPAETPSLLQSSTLSGGAPKPADSKAPPPMNLAQDPASIFGAAVPATAAPAAGLFQGSYVSPSGAQAEDKKSEDKKPKDNKKPEDKKPEDKVPDKKPAGPMDLGAKYPPPSAIFGASTPTTSAPAGLFQGSYKAEPLPVSGSTPAPAPDSAQEKKPETTAPPPAQTIPNIFGTATQPQRPSTPPKAAPSVFAFGASAATGADKPAGGKPLFSAPAPQIQFGSPMKTDDPSPKKPTGGSTSGSSIFKFGASTSGPAGPAPSLFSGTTATTGEKGSSSNLFGNSFASVAPTATAPNSFNFGAGAGAGPAGGSSFNFGIGNNQGFNNPFAVESNGGNDNRPGSASTSFDFNFAGMPQTPNQQEPFKFGASTVSAAPAAGSPTIFSFGANTGAPSAVPSFGASFHTPSGRKRGASPALAASRRAGYTPGGGSSNAAASNPSFSFMGGTGQPAQPQQQQQSFTFGQQQGTTGAPAAPSLFSNLQQPQQPQQQGGGASASGTNSSFLFGGAGSSLAPTPAAGTPEPQPATAATTAADGDEETPQAQINLTTGGPGEEEETVLHEVRAKALKFVTPGQDSDEDNESNGRSPWVVQGTGPLRLLQAKSGGTVRLLLRGEPRGNVALNRTVLPKETYSANEKYVKIMTSNDDGSGLETWMLQVRTKDAAATLAQALERHKGANQK